MEAKFGNYTYSEFARLKPWDWNVPDVPVTPYFNFEAQDFLFWTNFFENNTIVVVYVGVVYILGIFSLQKWMKEKPPMDLTIPLFSWNVVLSLFSIVGFIRTFPGFYYVLRQPNGFHLSICLKDFLDIPTAFWALMFVFSKFVQLGDTFFIVLRKRRLHFLQWYHHLVTMAMVWIIGSMLEPIILRWYIVLNYFAHSFLYPYMAFKVIGLRAPVWIPNFITTLQLIEMLTGLFVNVVTIYLFYRGDNCVRYLFSIQCSMFMYGSFTILFGKLFFDSVLKRRHKKAKGNKITAGNSTFDDRELIP